MVKLIRTSKPQDIQIPKDNKTTTINVIVNCFIPLSGDIMSCDKFIKKINNMSGIKDYIKFKQDFNPIINNYKRTKNHQLITKYFDDIKKQDFYGIFGLEEKELEQINVSKSFEKNLTYILNLPKFNDYGLTPLDRLKRYLINIINNLIENKLYDKITIANIKMYEFVHNFNSKNKEECSLEQYHSKGYGGKCQFIGFFGKEYENLIFQNFDSPSNHWIFLDTELTGKISTKDIYTENYSKDIDMGCWRLNYSKHIVKDKPAEGKGLPDEYIIINNKDIEIKIIDINPDDKYLHIIKNEFGGEYHLKLLISKLFLSDTDYIEKQGENIYLESQGVNIYLESASAPAPAPAPEPVQEAAQQKKRKNHEEHKKPQKNHEEHENQQKTLNPDSMKYEQKYLKYKQKYLELKNMIEKFNQL